MGTSITDKDLSPENGSKMIVDLHKAADSLISMEAALDIWNDLKIPEKIFVKNSHDRIIG
jgi:hypothetical protein